MRTLVCLATLYLVGPIAVADAQTPSAGRTAEIRFRPTGHAQLALWIEKSDGTFLRTVRLTQAVSYRGIGNRPGAAQMNSSYRCPYGRREGVLPIWAHRRAAAPAAAQFSRVIFQDRLSEGDASQTSNDSSPEPYFCLSFMTGNDKRAALDAISCATALLPRTDKGRYLSAADVVAGYAEPTEAAGIGVMRPLSPESLYPPRRDVIPCAQGCPDRADVGHYDTDARGVMPDIDAVTMATAPDDVAQTLLFSFPDDWSGGDYVLWVEANVEGDHNDAFSKEAYPFPKTLPGAWDSWAATGYAYRGQPSVVYRVSFVLGGPAVFGTSAAYGYGDVDGFGPRGGDVRPLDALITADPVTAPGSGADRLRSLTPGGNRLELELGDSRSCQGRPPAVPTNVTAVTDPDRKQSHQWGILHFNVPQSDVRIAHYEARFTSNQISAADTATFDRALPALAAKADAEALMIPTDAPAGTGVDVHFGGMSPQTSYHIAVRAVNACNVPGPYAVAQLTTTALSFTKLSGCFVATAAFGSALDSQVQSLRTVRDFLRPRSPLFAIASDLYERSGPAAAALVGSGGDVARVVRALLTPVIDAARAAAPLVGH